MINDLLTKKVICYDIYSGERKTTTALNEITEFLLMPHIVWIDFLNSNIL